ncbi:MAG: AMP-binding protein, partial [Cyclobacteriaceae bacterium]|nr:AMP-binding protein [Cyclobacteriaceae bacterium]
MEDRSNYTPLTPQSFLRRSVRTYPESTAVIYGDLKFTYTQFYERVCRQANALMSLGLNSGDSVAVL